MTSSTLIFPHKLMRFPCKKKKGPISRIVYYSVKTDRDAEEIDRAREDEDKSPSNIQEVCHKLFLEQLHPAFIVFKT